MFIDREYSSCLGECDAGRPGDAAPLPVLQDLTPLWGQRGGDGVVVVMARLDLASHTVAALGCCLSVAEQARADGYVYAADRRRFIVARARLRQLLSERTGVAPQALKLGCGDNGKPLLIRHQAQPDWRFNLAHAGEVALFALSAGREVGIDIEMLRPMRGADELAAVFFSPRETAEYRALGAHDKLMGFFNCWTRKEAFVKALGQCSCWPGKDFDVSLAPGAPAVLLRVGSTPGDQSGWQLASFIPAEGFVAAVVSERREAHLVASTGAFKPPVFPARQHVPEAPRLTTAGRETALEMVSA